MSKQMFQDDFPPFCAYAACQKMRDEHPGLAWTQDRLGNHWCEEHAHRGRIIDYGMAHNWPEIDVETFVITGMPQAYIMSMMYCPDDEAWLAEAAMEYQKSSGSEVAS